jgi:hypothetical protein
MSTSRRGLLAVASVLPLAGAAVAQQPSPDAELIRLCGEFNTLERQRIALFDVPGLSDRERDGLQEPFSAGQRTLLDQIYEMEATTLAGILARLEMIHLYNPQLLVDPQGWDDEMLNALLHDALTVLRGGAA